MSGSSIMCSQLSHIFRNKIASSYGKYYAGNSYTKLCLPEKESYYGAAQKIYYMVAFSLKLTAVFCCNHCVYKENTVIRH